MNVSMHSDDRDSRLVKLAVTDPSWSNFVQQCEGALAFHLPAWTRTLTETYRFKSFCLANRRDDGSISAGMPVVAHSRLGRHRWVSLPFTDVCPPLGDEPDVTSLLAGAEALAAANHVRRVEIRSPAAAAAYASSRGVVHELQLNGDADALVKTFSKSQVQRNIARARRAGVVVRWGECQDDLVGVFLGLHRATRRRLGVLCQPQRFFDHLWNLMIAPRHGFVLISYVRDTAAAAAVFLLGGGTVTYKFGASDSAYWPERPNHLLFWEAIRWGCENGYRAFDFGRTDWGNEGLRAFKRGWGTTERELVYSSLGAELSPPRKARLSVIGPVIRHTPEWVNRAVGRSLYRLAA